MTHLSDFSYLQRCAIEVYIAFFLFHSVYVNDGMRCLSPKKIVAGNLKSIITLLYITMLFMQMSYDIASTWIKYQEKFMVEPGTLSIISTPFVAWDSKHQDIAEAFDYIECINLSMQTSVFFLLQCFWNYLSNSVAKKSFMSSREFKFYIFWALGSAAIFPILQWYHRENIQLREAVPQFAYSIEVLLTAFLGVRSHFRFERLLNISRNLSTGASVVVEKLSYFRDMNALLTVILFFDGLGLLILCADGLTNHMVINTNKFASDLLIANCNACTVFIWLIGISIFHPRRTREERDASLHGKSTHSSSNTRQDIEKRHDSQISRKMDSSRSSEPTKGSNQRIVSFIEAKNKQDMTTTDASTLYDKDIPMKHFMRPMSPIEADYPLDPRTAVTPTEKLNIGHSVSIPDPYAGQPVHFTMMDNGYHQSIGRPSFESSFRSASPSINTSRQGLHQPEQPIKTMSGMVSDAYHDFYIDPMRHSLDYLSPSRHDKS